MAVCPPGTGCASFYLTPSSLFASIASVPRMIEEVHAVESREIPDYPALQFDPHSEFIATGRTGAPFDGAGWDFGWKKVRT